MQRSQPFWVPGRHDASGQVQDGFLFFAVDVFGDVPVGVVVQGQPAAFFGAVEPVFVVLVEHLDVAGFEDVEDFVVTPDTETKSVKIVLKSLSEMNSQPKEYQTTIYFRR